GILRSAVHSPDLSDNGAFDFRLCSALPTRGAERDRVSAEAGQSAGRGSRAITGLWISRSALATDLSDGARRHCKRGGACVFDNDEGAPRYLDSRSDWLRNSRHAHLVGNERGIFRAGSGTVPVTAGLFGVIYSPDP